MSPRIQVLILRHQCSGIGIGPPRSSGSDPEGPDERIQERLNRLDVGSVEGLDRIRSRTELTRIVDGNPWTTKASKKVYQDGWFSVVEHEVQDASGKDSTYGVVHFRKVGLRILPIDEEGHTFFVGQYRFGAGYYSWESPAGGGEKGESPEKGAARELREEVGLEAEHWLPLPHLIPSGAITDERQHIFLAWGLKGTRRDPDPQEVVRVWRLPFGEALRMVLDGEVADAGTVAAILLAHLRAMQGGLPQEVAIHLR